MIVTIKGIYRDEKETKYGKKDQVALKVEENEVIDQDGTSIQVGDRYIRGLFAPGQSGTEEWENGDQVNIRIAQSGDFLNFKMADGDQPTQKTPLVDRVKRLEDAVFNQKEAEAKVEEPVDPTDDF